jgi:hypothetical protein
LLLIVPVDKLFTGRLTEPETVNPLVIDTREPLLEIDFVTRLLFTVVPINGL